MNLRQQRFIDEYLADPNATQAATKAGYKWPDKVGSQLLGKTRIREAIAERQAEHRGRCEITRETLTRMLLEDREMARRNGQPGAAIQACMGLAKLHGLLVDRSEKTIISMSPEERAKRIAELTERLESVH